jgi:beta-glucanase (GH16 family)
MNHKIFSVLVLAGGLLAFSTCKKTDSVQVSELPIPTTGYTTPTSYAGMTLVWQDEFTGDQLNTTDWNYETGGTGWGNHELEYYQQSNTSVRDGYLIIQAKQENAGSQNYTSSRLTTQGKQAFQYARVDIRAVLPKGQGIWPALWMLGSSISTVGWPACGEVDIMELIGGSGKDNTVYGTAHWDSAGHVSSGNHQSLQNGKIFADDFHVFTIIWNASSITWYIDDIQYFTLPISSDQRSALRNEFFFIFNVAVGGDWPGSPDVTTIFPQQMVVDYIRVFQ